VLWHPTLYVLPCDDGNALQVADVHGDTKVDIVVGNSGSSNKVYPTDSFVANEVTGEFTIVFGTTTDVGAPSGGWRTDDTRTVTVCCGL
jgi:hypothetical protein